MVRIYHYAYGFSLIVLLSAFEMPCTPSISRVQEPRSVDPVQLWQLLQPLLLNKRLRQTRPPLLMCSFFLQGSLRVAFGRMRL